MKEKSYKLAIAITTYNRQQDCLKLVNILSQFIKDHSDCCIVVHNDGGEFDLSWNFLNRLSYCVVHNDTSNNGVYRAKYGTIKLAASLANWVIHSDDDDILDLGTLDYVYRYLDNYEKSNYGMIQFNLRRISQYTDKFEDRLAMQGSKNAMCLNGLLMKSNDIEPNLETYPSTELWNYTNRKDCWGDDVVIAGYLSQGITDDRIITVDKYLTYQTYFEVERHLCNDPIVSKRTKSSNRKYIRIVNQSKL